LRDFGRELRRLTAKFAIDGLQFGLFQLEQTLGGEAGAPFFGKFIGQSVHRRFRDEVPRMLAQIW